jgi:hypothetical protein
LPQQLKVEPSDVGGNKAMTEPTKYTILQKVVAYPIAYLIVGILALVMIAIALVPVILLGGQFVSMSRA